MTVKRKIKSFSLFYLKDESLTETWDTLLKWWWEKAKDFRDFHSTDLYFLKAHKTIKSNLWTSTENILLCMQIAATKKSTRRNIPRRDNPPPPPPAGCSGALLPFKMGKSFWFLAAGSTFIYIETNSRRKSLYTHIRVCVCVFCVYKWKQKWGIETRKENKVWCLVWVIYRGTWRRHLPSLSNGSPPSPPQRELYIAHHRIVPSRSSIILYGDIHSKGSIFIARLVVIRVDKADPPVLMRQYVWRVHGKRSTCRLLIGWGSYHGCINGNDDGFQFNFGGVLNGSWVRAIDSERSLPIKSRFAVS